ncbi:hypothetical protein TWF718_009648 [Orbilia javanica]|uniref:Nucleoside phosphorylase domain-containing protein n=1 Tax=Orbilia javanica TaxID=47235 RepID=A0AAN8MKJ2_9PEZI
MSASLKTHEDYTIGWVCALPKEQTAAISMLDEEHAGLDKYQTDENAYTLGSIGPHNVVITCLPLNCYGTNQAARATAQMLSTFPSVKIILMVGIGAGIPTKVKLGDVVISTEWTQWDLGKSNKNGSFEHIDKRYYPSTELLSAMSRLRTNHELHGTRIPQYLGDLNAKYPRLASQYPSVGKPEDVKVHYGLIASGNQVVKDARVRDAINKRLSNRVCCIEMEAAGLMGSGFSAVIIRGVCDYADSNKNDDWQGYAAAVSAACAKEFLQCVQLSVASTEIKVRRVDLNTVVDEIATLRYDLAEDENHKILNWITPIDDSPQHNDILSRRQPGTGKWFLTSPQYQNWINTKKAILFCPGIPGAGKTVLSSTVIDHLTDRYFYNPSVGIAYIYFNFKRSATSLRVDDLLLYLLKQLARTQDLLPKCVIELYNRYKNSRPSRTDILNALHAVTTSYSRTFIIIDALDEYGERSIFLENLFKVHRSGNFNIFATSRDIPEIKEKFRGISMEYEIRASNEDVRVYLEGRIAKSGRKIINANKETIIAGISKAVQGMFLLAHLYFEAIKTAMTLKAIENILDGFATGRGTSIALYDSTYRVIMERINENAETVDIAFQVLSWITCASRPLTKAELQHAIAVEPDEPEINKKNISEVEDLVSVCEGLITIDEESNVVRLIHYTVQEYFERNWQQWFPNSHSDIAKTCIIYLSYDNFKTGPCQGREEFEERLQSNALYSYAATNWSYHVRESSTDVDSWHSPGSSMRFEADWCTRRIEIASLVLNLLLKDSLRLACMQAMFGYYQYFFGQWTWNRMRWSHIAAYCGLTLIMGMLLEEKGAGLDARGGDGCTPLWIAALRGHKEVAKILISKGADLEARDRNGCTPLWIAAASGHANIVRLLAEKNADLEANNNSYFKWLPITLSDGVHIEGNNRYTPLWIAAINGHKKVVKLLMEKGADLETKDNNGCTLLWIMAAHGCEGVVRLLVEKGADLEARDDDGFTPLWIAVECGEERVARLLAKKGADLEARSDSGCTPLWVAAANDDEEISELLIYMGADPEAKNDSGCTPLWIAAASGCTGVVRLLVESGVDLEARDDDGCTPLWIAVERGHEAVVRVLASNGADLEARDNDGRTPLWVAAAWGHENIVRVFEEREIFER